MKFNFTQPVTRKTAIILVVSLCAITVIVGDGIPFLFALGEIPDFDKFWRAFGPVLLSWLELPLGFLFLVHKDSIMHDFPSGDSIMSGFCHDFSVVYWSAVVSFTGIFIWLRRWPLLLVPATLLLIGVAGCWGFAGSIQLAK